MKRTLAWLLTALLILVLPGCQADGNGTVSVTGVEEICGLGPVGWTEKFSGVVTARSEVEILKDAQKSIAQILVEEGAGVREGDVLFSYEEGQAELQLQRAELELQQLEYALQAHKEKKLELEKLKAKAKAEQQLSYTVEIAETDALIRETEYNILNKQTDIEALSLSLQNLDVVSPVTGVVQSLNPNGGIDNYGNEKPFMVLTETGNRRIKAYVNETYIAQLSSGVPMVIHSRTGEETWLGTVSYIDFEASQSSGENFYMGAVDDTLISSKYPFYVELESDEGLILGQHVYLTLQTEQAEAQDRLMLPVYYVAYEPDGSAFVWAADSRQRLEKRPVSLGETDESMGTCEILSGLTREDSLAFPEETLQEGMHCLQGAGEASDEDAEAWDDPAAVVPDDMK